MQLIHFARARRPFGNIEALAALAWYLQYLTVRVAPVVFRSELLRNRRRETRSAASPCSLCYGAQCELNNDTLRAGKHTDLTAYGDGVDNAV